MKIFLTEADVLRIARNGYYDWIQSEFVFQETKKLMAGKYRIETLEKKIDLLLEYLGVEVVEVPRQDSFLKIKVKTGGTE